MTVSTCMVVKVKETKKIVKEIDKLYNCFQADGKRGEEDRQTNGDRERRRMGGNRFNLRMSRRVSSCNNTMHASFEATSSRDEDHAYEIHISLLN